MTGHYGLSYVCIIPMLFYWSIKYYRTNDKKALESDKTWIEKSIETKTVFMNVDTYGYILYKLDDLEKAEQQLLKAKKLNDNWLPKESEQLLKEIQKKINQ